MDKRNMNITLEGGKMTESLEWAVEPRQSNQQRMQQFEGKVISERSMMEEESPSVSPRTKNTHWRNKNSSPVLKEMKKQFDVLKMMKVSDSLLEERNYDYEKERSSYLSSEFKNQINISAISSSSKNNPSQSLTMRHNNSNLSKNLQIAQYEKKHLEVMLENSLDKISELLKNQSEYKQQVYLLKKQLQMKSEPSLLEKKPTEKTNFAHLSDKSEINLAENEEYHHLKSENSRLKQSIGHLENELAKNLKGCREEEQRQRETVLLLKQKYLSEEIERSRAEKERDILKKQKDAEINYLKNILKKHQEKDLSQTGTDQISHLRQEIALKDKRYMILLNEFEERKMNKETQLYNELMSKLDEKKKEGLLEESLKLDIGELRKQIEENHQKEGEEYEIRQKLRLLEKERSLEEIEKKRFMEELRKLIEENDRIYEENTALKKKIQKIKHTGHLQTGKSQIPTSYVKCQQENIELRETINVLELQFKQMKEEIQSYQEIENQQKQRINQLLRQIDQLKFSIEKSEKKAQLEFELEKKRIRNDEQILAMRLSEAEEERNKWMRQFESMKAFYNVKVEELKRVIESNRIEHESENERRAEQVERFKEEMGSEMEKMKRLKIEEKEKLIERLNYVSKEGEKSAEMIEAEKQMGDLNKKVKELSIFRQNIDHLWRVKSEEYSNIDHLLRELHV